MDIGLQEFYRRIQLAPAITRFLPEEITGGGAHVDAVVGDPACAVSIDCDGGMEVGQESEPAA